MTDRTPPHDLDAERSLLGACMLSPKAIDAAVDVLTATDFYHRPHQTIYDAITTMHVRGDAVDMVSVASELQGLLDVVGGRNYLMDVVNAVPLASNAPQYAKTIHDLAKARRLITLCSEIATTAYEAPSDIDEVVAKSVSEVMNASMGQGTSMSVQDLVSARLKDSGPRDFLIVPGFAGLHLGRGDLTIIGARPAAGKTALVTHWALEWAQQVPVAFYSYEMTGEQIADRIISRYSGLSVEDVEEGLGEAAEVAQSLVSDGLAARNLRVKVAAGMSPARLFSDMRRFAANGGRVVIIDYIQLAVDSRHAFKQGLTAATTSFTNALKDVALETGLNVIALSQLNRASAERGGIKVPILSDLRESGAIEQAGNEIALLMALPNPRLDPQSAEWIATNTQGWDFDASQLIVDGDPDNDKTLVLVSWCKVRQGRLRRSYLIFNGACMRWEMVQRHTGTVGAF